MAPGEKEHAVRTAAVPTAIEKIWAQRAEELSQTVLQTVPGVLASLLVFTLGSEQFGIETKYTLETRPAEQITRVPRVPDWVAGVVNLRGHILSVIDLRRFLRLPASGQDQVGQPALIFIQDEDMELAFLVDGILDVEDIPVEEIRKAAGDSQGQVTTGISHLSGQERYTSGVVKRDKVTGLVGENEWFAVLNVPEILSDKGLIIQDEVM